MADPITITAAKHLGFGSLTRYLDADFVYGAIAILVLTSLWGYIKIGLEYLKRRFWDHFICVIEVKSTDETFTHLLKWLDHSRYTTETKNLTVLTHRGNMSDGRTRQNKPTLVFTPGSGLHMFRYKGVLIWLRRDRQQNDMNLNGMIREDIYLTAMSKTPDILKEILQEAINHALRDEIGTVGIYTPTNNMSGWYKTLNKPKRSITSVVLEDGISQSILKDVTKFIDGADWYRSRGLPHRRGYLFYGKPGCGKSSFIFAIAGELDLAICCLSLSDDLMTDTKLAALLRNCPKDSIILLEDIDCVFHDRAVVTNSFATPSPDQPTQSAQPQGAAASKITFSGLLNAIDGVAAQEGRLVFLTTNHREKLSPALIRPGRVDIQVHFDLASDQQIRQLFQVFYPDAEPMMAEKFGEKVKGGTHSMAKLQGHLLKHRDSAQEALDFAHEVEMEDGKLTSGLSASVSTNAV